MNGSNKGWYLIPHGAAPRNDTGATFVSQSPLPMRADQRASLKLTKTREIPRHFAASAAQLKSEGRKPRLIHPSEGGDAV